MEPEKRIKESLFLKNEKQIKLISTFSYKNHPQKQGFPIPGKPRKTVTFIA